MKFLKENWKYILGIALFLLLEQIIHTIPAARWWLVSAWTAGDIITCGGTLFLGYITFKQTVKANQLSQKVAELEDQKFKMEIRPFAMVVNYSFRHTQLPSVMFNSKQACYQIAITDETEEIVALILSLQNTTESFITVEYNEGFVEGDASIRLNKGSFATCLRKLCLAPMESGDIVLFCNRKEMDQLFSNRWITLEFVLENRFAERYKERFRMIFVGTSISYENPKDNNRTISNRTGYFQDYSVELCGKKFD